MNIIRAFFKILSLLFIIAFVAILSINNNQYLNLSFAPLPIEITIHLIFFILIVLTLGILIGSLNWFIYNLTQKKN